MISNNLDLLKLKEISIKNKVESLRDSTLDLLINTINNLNIKNILEIGTGIGYSSYAINKFSNHIVNITTIEKDKNRYEIAKENLSVFKNTTIINIDCFELNKLNLNQFDLIIIDGPKKNQIQLIEYLQNFLTPKGIFFIDNLYLNKLRNRTNLSNSQKKIINDVDNLNFYIKNQHNFKCKLFDIDDGVCILYKK